MTTYSTSEFAQIAGVTVKALRHYERVGLLSPRRTGARYRRYSMADLQRLDRVLALKSLGLTLDMVRTMLAGGTVSLRSHRESLEERRARIDRSIEALKLMEEPPRASEAVDHYVCEAAWVRWEAQRLKRASPMPRVPDRASQSRVALFGEIEAALAAGPVAPAVGRALIRRCRDAIEPETLEALKTRKNWPSGMRRYVASLYAMSPEEWERVAVFIETGSGPIRSRDSNS